MDKIEGKKTGEILTLTLEENMIERVELKEYQLNIWRKTYRHLLSILIKIVDQNLYGLLKYASPRCGARSGYYRSHQNFGFFFIGRIKKKNNNSHSPTQTFPAISFGY